MFTKKYMKNMTKNLILSITALFVFGVITNFAQAQTYGTTYQDNATVTCNSAVLLGDVSIDPPGTPTSVWFEWGVNNYTPFNGSTYQQTVSYSSSFSRPLSNLSPSTTYYYRAVASNYVFGTKYGVTRTFTTPQCNQAITTAYYTGGVTQTVVVTSLPTSINQTSASLNGISRLNNNNANTNGWFEWGITSALGNSTETKYVGNTSYNVFNQPIYNLSSNTTYYYRAVAQNQFGVFRGDIVSFSTREPVAETIYHAPMPAYVAPKINVSSSKPSLISLSINNDNEGVCRGDFTAFTINYTNTSSENLKNVILLVVLPTELSYQDSSRGTYSEKDNTITVNVGTLAPNESGILVVKSKVVDVPQGDKALVTSARTVYTRENGAQEEVIAYTLEKAQCISTNVGLAFFGGDSFFPVTLIGWLTLIVILLVLVVFSRSLYGTYGRKTGRRTGDIK